MSEEKLYAVKNDKGVWLSLDSSHESVWYTNNPTLFKDKSYAEAQSMGRKAHVVELVEAPAKVVITKEQAEIVEEAHVHVLPACYISEQPDDEELLMKAYVNGYTVEKEKKYNVKVPHTGAGWWYAKPDPDINHGKGCAQPAFIGINNPPVRLTDAEIIKYGLQDCEKMEVKD